MELAFEPGKGIGVKVKVEIKKNNTGCIAGDEFEEKYGPFHQYEIIANKDSSEIFIRPHDDITVQYTEYGPYNNSGLPATVDGDGQIPNV